MGDELGDFVVDDVVKSDEVVRLEICVWIVSGCLLEGQMGVWTYLGGRQLQAPEAALLLVFARRQMFCRG
jgi:hypothetical protein